MNYERGALNDSSYNHFPPFIKVPPESIVLSIKSVRGIFGVARGFLMPETSQNCTPHTFVVSQEFRFLSTSEATIYHYQQE